MWKWNKSGSNHTAKFTRENITNFPKKCKTKPIRIENQHKYLPDMLIQCHLTQTSLDHHTPNILKWITLTKKKDTEMIRLAVRIPINISDQTEILYGDKSSVPIQGNDALF